MAMERGYRYHAMFIYNKPELKNNRHVNPDYELSFNVVKFAVAQLAIWGFEKTYYHDRDAVPGSNKFDEFFYSVKASRFTVVVFTREFLKDCWGKYKSQAAFTNLIDKNESNRFIALFIGVDDQQIPDAFRTMNSLSFSNDWPNEHGEWKRFKRLLKNVTHAVQDTESEVVPVIQGNNNLETDAGPEDLDDANDNLQPGNQNTTNSPYYRDQSNQQSSGGNQPILGFSMAQSNEILYQRNRTNGLNSNNSAPVAITTDTIASSTTTASQHSTTKTGVGLTSSENSQGVSYVWSTMRRMIPGAKSTMKNTVGTMIKHSMNFVQKCDQSYI